MNHKNNTESSGMPFKHGVPAKKHTHPGKTDDFDNNAAQGLTPGRAVIFNDLHRSRVMFVGQVDASEDGKPIYSLYADPEALRSSGITDYYLDGAVLMTTDIYRMLPKNKPHGFYLAPTHMNKPEDIAAAEFKQVETIYDLYANKHEARSRREAVYKCYRCKRQAYLTAPDDVDPITFCGIPPHLEVHAENPEECVYFWFDRWFGSPPDVR